MTSDTKAVTLDDAVELIIDHRGRTPKKLGGEFSPAGIQVISAKHVFGGRLHLEENQRFVEPGLARRWMPNRLADGDVLLTSEAPLGEVAYVSGDHDLCLGQRLFALRARKGVTDSRFLFFLLCSPEIRHRLHARATGTTAQGIKQSELRKVEIDLPPLRIQQVVGSLLATLDNKIESNRRLGVLLEEISTVAFRARFGDSSPFDRPHGGGVGSTSRGWVEGHLSDLVSVTMGQSPPGSSYTGDPERGVLLVQGMGGFGDRYPTSTTWTSRPTKRVDAGATLMTVRAPVGAVNIARSEVCIGRGVAAIHSPYPAFTEFLVRNLNSRWASEESGTIFPAINKGQILGLTVIIPPNAEIQAYEEFARPIVDQLLLLSNETQHLREIRDSLLPRLTSGEIRVPDTANPDEAIGAALKQVA